MQLLFAIDILLLLFIFLFLLFLFFYLQSFFESQRVDLRIMSILFKFRMLFIVLLTIHLSEPTNPSYIPFTASSFTFTSKIKSESGPGSYQKLTEHINICGQVTIDYELQILPVLNSTVDIISKYTSNGYCTWTLTKSSPESSQTELLNLEIEQTFRFYSDLDASVNCFVYTPTEEKISSSFFDNPCVQVFNPVLSKNQIQFSAIQILYSKPDQSIPFDQNQISIKTPDSFAFRLVNIPDISDFFRALEDPSVPTIKPGTPIRKLSLFPETLLPYFNKESFVDLTNLEHFHLHMLCDGFSNIFSNHRIQRSFLYYLPHFYRQDRRAWLTYKPNRLYGSNSPSSPSLDPQPENLISENPYFDDLSDQLNSFQTDLVIKSPRLDVVEVMMPCAKINHFQISKNYSNPEFMTLIFSFANLGEFLSDSSSHLSSHTTNIFDVLVCPKCTTRQLSLQFASLPDRSFVSHLPDLFFSSCRHHPSHHCVSSNLEIVYNQEWNLHMGSPSPTISRRRSITKYKSSRTPLNQPPPHVLWKSNQTILPSGLGTFTVDSLIVDDVFIRILSSIDSRMSAQSSTTTQLNIFNCAWNVSFFTSPSSSSGRERLRLSSLNITLQPLSTASSEVHNTLDLLSVFAWNTSSTVQSLGIYCAGSEDTPQTKVNINGIGKVKSLEVENCDIQDLNLHNGIGSSSGGKEGGGVDVSLADLLSLTDVSFDVISSAIFPCATEFDWHTCCKNVRALRNLNRLILKNISGFPSVLSEKMLCAIPKLQQLSLVRNSISVVEDSLLEKLPLLADMDLSHNNLDRMPNHVIANAGPLTAHLDLSHNLIAEVNPRFCVHSTIHRLDLSHNNLTFVDFKSFLSQCHLSPGAKLSFAGNSLTNVSIHGIKFDFSWPLRSTLEFDFSHNRIEDFHIHLPYEKTLFFEIRESPRVAVDLSSNALARFKSGSILNTPILMFLNLSNNEITDVGLEPSAVINSCIYFGCFVDLSLNSLFQSTADYGRVFNNTPISMLDLSFNRMKRFPSAVRKIPLLLPEIPAEPDASLAFPILQDGTTNFYVSVILSHNEISSIRESICTFSDAFIPVYYDLSNSSVRYVGPDAFVCSRGDSSSDKHPGINRTCAHVNSSSTTDPANLTVPPADYDDVVAQVVFKSLMVNLNDNPQLHCLPPPRTTSGLYLLSVENTDITVLPCSFPALVPSLHSFSLSQRAARHGEGAQLPPLCCALLPLADEGLQLVYVDPDNAIKYGLDGNLRKIIISIQAERDVECRSPVIPTMQDARLYETTSFNAFRRSRTARHACVKNHQLCSSQQCTVHGYVEVKAAVNMVLFTVVCVLMSTLYLVCALLVGLYTSSTATTSGRGGGYCENGDGYEDGYEGSMFAFNNFHLNKVSYGIRLWVASPSSLAHHHKEREQSIRASRVDHTNCNMDVICNPSITFRTK